MMQPEYFDIPGIYKHAYRHPQFLQYSRSVGGF